jgi:hypothetical protein
MQHKDGRAAVELCQHQSAFEFNQKSNEHSQLSALLPSFAIAYFLQHFKPGTAENLLDFS